MTKIKPWQFVRVSVQDRGVEQGRRSFIGEVVSYPFPAPQGESVNVRQIPGDPTSMIAVRTADCAVLPVKTVTVAYASVEEGLTRGIKRRRRYFDATDMLRYDVAVPVNFKISYDEDGRAEVPTGELLIATTYQRLNRVWTPERWASFGWKLTPRPELTKTYRAGSQT